MSNYQMTLADGICAISGVSRDDDAGAMREASVAACDILRDELREGRSPATVTVTVTTDAGQAVGTIRVTGSIE